MGSKAISIAAVIVLIIVGLFVWGAAERGGTAQSVQQAAAGSGAKSALAASEAFFDFGTISMKNGNVTKDFTITNPTGADIAVSTVVTSCMCTTAFIVEPGGNLKGPFGMEGMGYVPPANEIIKAGESRTIRVAYDPNAHGPAGVGAVDRFVALTDGAGGMLTLEIKALVTP